MKTAAALLAGGYSRRMGRDKAGLSWAEGTLLDQQAATLRASGANELILSCRAEQQLQVAGFRLVPDRMETPGPMSALAALWAQTGAEVLLVLAIDLPLVPARWLNQIRREAGRDAVSLVPRMKGHYEPLAAAWHRSAIPSLQAALSTGNGSLQDVCRELAADGRLREIRANLNMRLWFTNLNSPADHSQAWSHATGKSDSR